MKRHASMNRIYRLVWNQTLGILVAVAENAKGRGKSVSGRKLIAAALALTGGVFMTPLAMAGPTGGQVSAGTGTITQSGVVTSINQSSANIAINWQSFNIAAGETVNFLQPSVTAVALNRVVGQNPSQIFGNLNANGQVFVLNPNGVLFGAGSQVNVGGLVASTLSMSDADFMAGNNVFANAGAAGAVVNQGLLNAANGGYIALLGSQVSNQGVMTATLGTAILAAGDKITLNMNNGSLLGYSIDQGAINALAENKQLIQANGGLVIMSAKAADALTASVVNNTGIVEATGFNSVGGRILLEGDAVTSSGTLDASGTTGGNITLQGGATGTSIVSGAVNASGSAGAGGKVNVLGDKVGLFAGANVNVTGDAGGGTALIGGDYQGKNAAIQNASQTIVDSAASINADAVNTGNGGKVIVWSNDATRVHGSISAQGGTQSGNGGFVETSAHFLDVAGIRVNAGAANGAAGNWLLDPTNINIVATAASDVSTLTTVSAFANAGPTAGTSNLDVALMNGAGSNVMLQATNNITFSTNVNIAGPGVGLYAQAGGNIAWGANTITTSGGAIQFTANDVGGTPTGAGGISGTGAITTVGGTISLNTSGTGTISTGALNAGSGGLVNLTSLGTISAGAVTAGTLTTSAVGGTTLNGPGNAVTNFGATDIGAVSLTNNTAATLGLNSSTAIGGLTVSNTGAIQLNGVQSAGAGIVNLSATGNLALNAAINTTNATASAIILKAGSATAAGTSTGGDITVAGGSLNYGAGGRATLYTGSVAGSTTSAALAGIAGSGMFRYNSNAGATNYTAVLGAGTYEIYRERPTVTITANSPAAINYGSALPALTTAVAGAANGDTAIQAFSTQATVATDGIVSASSNLTAATHTLTASGAVDQLGYAVNYATGSLVVNKLALTGAAIAAVNTTYGTPAANGAVTFGNNIALDVVGTTATTVGGTNSTSGNLKAASYTQTAGALAGADSANYSFAGFTSAANYTVGQLALTGAAIAAVNTTYGTPAANGAVTFGNNIALDVVGATATTVGGTNSTSGNLKAASYTQTAGALAGADSANYSFAGFTSAANYTVGQLALTGAAIAAVNTTYGTPAANGAVTFGNNIALDVVGTTATTVGGTNSTSGNLKAASYTQTAGALAGADSANYSFAGFTSAANYTVGQLALTGAAIAAVNTTYGTPAANGAVTFGNNIALDVVGTTATTVGGTNSTSGNLKAASYTQTAGALAGADSANYSFAGFTSAANYTVGQLALTGAAIAAVNTTYGTPAANGAVTFGNNIALDVVATTATTVGGTNSTSGNLKAASYTQTAGALAGADSANYSFAGFTSAANYTVGQLALNITGITASNKVYDATTAATLTGVGTAVALSADVVTVGGVGAGLFADALVGNGKAVTVSGYTIGGGDAGNYTVVQPSGLTANITAAPGAIASNTPSQAVAALGGAQLAETYQSVSHFTPEVISILDPTESGLIEYKEGGQKLPHGVSEL